MEESEISQAATTLNNQEVKSPEETAFEFYGRQSPEIQEVVNNYIRLVTTRRF